MTEGDRPRSWRDPPGDRPVALADEADLDALVERVDLVLVEFYTEGCGICASMEPVLGIVAKASDATVATVNPRDDAVLVDRFDIRSVPTLVLFRDGEEVGRLADGFQSVEQVVDFVSANA
jgi:thioredoxin-like negative regulator of GroEL